MTGTLQQSASRHSTGRLRELCPAASLNPGRRGLNRPGGQAERLANPPLLTGPTASSDGVATGATASARQTYARLPDLCIKPGPLVDDQATVKPDVWIPNLPFGTGLIGPSMGAWPNRNNGVFTP